MMQHEKADSSAQRECLDAIIVGTGRCGSTMLSNLFREHPDVLSLSEFFVLLNAPLEAEEMLEARDFWDILAAPSLRLRPLLQSGIRMSEFLYPFHGNARFTPETGVPPILMVTLPHLTEDYEVLFDELHDVVGQFPRDYLAGHYARLFAWLQERFGRKICIERSGHSLMLLPGLVRVFPRARFVHLVRNGRECVWSMYRHPGFRMAALVGGRETTNSGENMPGTEAFDLARIIAAPMPFAAFGDLWTHSLLTGLRALVQLPEERVLTVRYEDIVADPHKTVARIADFVDSSLCTRDWLERVAAMVRQPDQSWKQLSAEDRDALERASASGQQLLDTLLQKGLYSEEVSVLLHSLGEHYV